MSFGCQGVELFRNILTQSQIFPSQPCFSQTLLFEHGGESMHLFEIKAFAVERHPGRSSQALSHRAVPECVAGNERCI